MLLAAQHLSHACGADETVSDLSLEIAPGQLTLFTGPPAAGHDLLLRLLGLLEPPQAGEIWLEGEPTAAMTAQDRAMLRTRRMGYVFADPFLLPAFSLVENIAMPLFKILHLSLEEARPRVHRWLEFVGLDAYSATPAAELPAEAQPLAALARALVHEPRILCVERLDARLSPHAQLHFVSLLQRAVNEGALTVLLSAATRAVAAFTDRVIELENGRVRFDSQSVTS